MNYSNEAVLKMLENNNSKLTLNVKFSIMRDNDGYYTDYTNLDRYVYANTKQIQNNLLPRFMLIGAFVACVFYKGQIPKKNICKICLTHLDYIILNTVILPTRIKIILAEKSLSITSVH